MSSKPDVIDSRALAEILIRVECVDNQWQMTLHGRREVLAGVENVKIVAHQGSKATCEEYAKLLQDAVVDRINWELRQRQIKAA